MLPLELDLLLEQEVGELLVRRELEAQRVDDLPEEEAQRVLALRDRHRPHPVPFTSSR